MASVVIKGNSSGSGSVTIEAPNTNSDYTVTLPQATTTVVGTDATQTLTNKTLGSGLVAGASLITSETSKASTSGTNIDFTGIPSWVKRITVMYSGVSTNGTSNHLIQLGDSGGIETTNYKSVGSYTTGGAGAAASSTAGFVLNTGANAARALTGTITFSLMNSSTNLWIVSGVGAFEDIVYMWLVSGSKTLSDTLTQVRITTVNGTDTFDAGSINILYE